MNFLKCKHIITFYVYLIFYKKHFSHSVLFSSIFLHQDFIYHFIATAFYLSASVALAKVTMDLKSDPLTKEYKLDISAVVSMLYLWRTLWYISEIKLFLENLTWKIINVDQRKSVIEEICSGVKPTCSPFIKCVHVVVRLLNEVCNSCQKTYNLKKIFF